MESNDKGRPDLVIFLVTVTLLVIGVVMVFSASFSTAGLEFNDPYHYLKRQLLWAAIGLVAMTVVMNVDYQRYRSLALPGFLFSLVLLGLVLVIGTEIGGAKRWINLGFFNLQPSEVMKLALINFMAGYIVYVRSRLTRFWKGLVPALVAVGLVFGLVMMEPDFGTAVAMVVTSVMMLFTAGAEIFHMVGLGLMAVPALLAMIAMEPYRLRRIAAFLNPWKDPLDSGWNIIQSLLAIGSGGLFGLGLGESRQKFSYLPEQHTDFIFAVIGEELGFIGATLIVLLFLLFAWRGYRIALKAPDLFGSMLAVGITTMVVFQALLNIGVVTASLPATGIPLPLISFGGSSLTVTLAGIGVLLSISKSVQ